MECQEGEVQLSEEREILRDAKSCGKDKSRNSTLIGDARRHPKHKVDQVKRNKWGASPSSGVFLRDTWAVNWSELGCQRVCQPLWNCAPDEFCHTATASERNKTFEPPQGVSDDSSAEESGVRRSSRQTKSREPKPFGDPVKHFIKEVSEELSGGALLKAHSRNTGRD